MVNLYVCKICGEPYIGSKPPSDCPFCGAPQEFVVFGEEYVPLWGVKLAPREKQNMEDALKAEVNATYYYGQVAKREKKYSKYNRLYKRLSTIEFEHASTIVKFLGVELPPIRGDEAQKDIRADLLKTQGFEAHDKAFYLQAAKDAVNPGVKMLFTALAHAESGHLGLVSKG
jgi:rubrerythrin